ncbi:MAG: ligase-associated DNA damage response exonuclease, partial [Planctomycetota bacterium]
VLRQRVHAGARIEGVSYGETTTINGVQISLHPAGHLLGSAQVRVEHAGRVEVVTGDYKTEPDLTCDPFEPVNCHRLITECTFGLPIYRWQPEAEIAADLNAWWAENRTVGRTSVVFAYALGKAQRVLSLIDRELLDGSPVVVHGSVKRFVEVYGAAGVDLPEVATSTDATRKQVKAKGLVVAPPSVLGTPWLKKFAPASLAFASGWMMVRGNRRRRGVDRGLVLSDHADWPGLLQTIEACGCESVGATHGYTGVLARYLREQGLDADEVATRYVGEQDLDPPTPDDPSANGADSGLPGIAASEPGGTA